MKRFIALACAALGLVSPKFAAAEEARKPVTFQGYLTLTSDYRNRGISLSDNDFALQGGLSASAPKGFNAGLFASSVAGPNANLELDVFATKSFNVKGANVAVGGIGYLFPGADNLNMAEATLSAARPLGPLDVTLGANYAPQQANLGGQDNVYVYTNAATPLGRIFSAPLTGAASFGYESGALSLGQDKLDWSLRLTLTAFGFNASLSYVDTNIASRITQPRAVFALTKRF